MNATARSSQSGNQLAKVAYIDHFAVYYPDWEFTPVQGPPILSGLRSSAKTFLSNRYVCDFLQMIFFVIIAL